MLEALRNMMRLGAGASTTILVRLAVVRDGDRNVGGRNLLSSSELEKILNIGLDIHILSDCFPIHEKFQEIHFVTTRVLSQSNFQIARWQRCLLSSTGTTPTTRRNKLSHYNPIIGKAYSASKTSTYREGGILRNGGWMLKIFTASDHLPQPLLLDPGLFSDLAIESGSDSCAITGSSVLRRSTNFREDMQFRASFDKDREGQRIINERTLNVLKERRRRAEIC
ncbi:hypothetical protein SISNIDRAFT_468445 [Sistotremastrum niveocremeum HHB9708]|uniref:Uncharacterized protein n=1 Tax=Sistotremastrum niveocremeum HHB9708 TaxID=1314777 RepID=A0A164RM55_9AGAM|nr:hypothetical protein SISNIDRAFT_468445 [Sistotremastrum niveocremeum HHB9708]